MILAGLDIETTGTDVSKGHRLIQLGMTVQDRDFAIDVCPVGDINISAEALGINKFTLSRIHNGLRTDYADKMASSWLKTCGYKHGSLTPVGWDVGGFDMVFIKWELPETAKYFSYRALDLTALAILHTLKTGKLYSELKSKLKERVVVALGEDKEHDALYDAKAALVTLQLFIEEFTTNA